MPILSRKTAQNVIILSIELNIIPVEILEQIVSAEDLGDFHQLI